MLKQVLFLFTFFKRSSENLPSNLYAPFFFLHNYIWPPQLWQKLYFETSTKSWYHCDFAVTRSWDWKLYDGSTYCSKSKSHLLFNFFRLWNLLYRTKMIWSDTVIAARLLLSCVGHHINTKLGHTRKACPLQWS